MMSLEEEIQSANQEAIDRINDAEPVLVDIKPAIDVIPGMTETTVLHAGPPIDWENMCGPMKNGIICGVLGEELAETPEEAKNLIEDGQISYGPCHEHQAVGGMTGITTASTSVNVVENKTFGNRAYCHLHEGLNSPERPARHFGSNRYEEVNKQFNWMEETIVPTLRRVIKAMGGINFKDLLSRSLAHGFDDLHGRFQITNSLLLRDMTPHLLDSDIPNDEAMEFFDFMDKSDIFVLHMAMAACRSMIDPAKDIDFSTVVTTFCRNGVEFGIRVSGMGDQWFTGPAGEIRGPTFSDFASDDSCFDLGDSCITETLGFGANISPTEFLYPGSYDFEETDIEGSFAKMEMNQVVDHIEKTYRITVDRSQHFRLPLVDFEGIPLGFDIRKIVETGIQPIINTAMAHKTEGGFIGVGSATAPMECFQNALDGFSAKYGS